MVSRAFLILTTLLPSVSFAQSDQIIFTMGQIDIFAREQTTTGTITNLTDGSVYATFSLANAGQRFERLSGVPQFVLVSASKPVTIFTGKALATRDDWSTVMSSNNNSEFGMEFYGFTEHYLWIFAPKDATAPPTEMIVLDTSDGDDSVILNSAHATFSNADVEIFELSGFENDNINVRCNRPCLAQVGSSIIKSSVGWSFTPPSVTPGEDGREIGTRFFFFANPDLTIFPFHNNTTVEIFDLSDGDDTSSVTMDADEFWSARNLPGVTGDRSLLHANDNLFDADFVEVRADRPVLTYVGPNYDPGGGFTLDFAPTVPTGPDQHEAFIYANQTGIEILTYAQTTTVTLGTVSGDASHALTITPGDWLGVGPYYWESTVSWSRELVHVVSNRPVVIFYGDFTPSYFSGCCSASFVPTILATRELPPVAEAGAAVLACPFDTVVFDGSGSFDQDDLGSPPGIVSYQWDFDTSYNSDGVNNVDDDIDSTSSIALYRYQVSGTYEAKLTVEDNEGDVDVDFLQVEIDIANLVLCGDDNDNDGIGANNDNCPVDQNPDQADQDGDGLGDVCDPDLDGDGVDNTGDNCIDVPNDQQEDLDLDTAGDACDPDDDGDGIDDLVDNCPMDANALQEDQDGDLMGDACDPDLDGDGVDNTGDNCPMTENGGQEDLDIDGEGDACDDDLDGDTVLNANDNCPRVDNLPQTDTDNDGEGDACDEDDDGDGIVDAVDNCPLVPNIHHIDTDNDGDGDACDDDDDGDGVPDASDNCPLVANPNQEDSDSNDVGDACTTVAELDASVPPPDSGTVTHPDATVVDGGSSAPVDAGLPKEEEADCGCSTSATGSRSLLSFLLVRR